MYFERGLFIDGPWRPKGGGGEKPVTDTSSGELLGRCPCGLGDDTAKAIVAASRASPAWAAIQAYTRAGILHGVAAALAATTQEAARITLATSSSHR